MNIKFEGYGYEWDAELVGGPCDGLLDRVVQLDGEKTPPKNLIKVLGKPMKKSKIGEKVLEDWSLPGLKNKKVAIYEIIKFDDDADYCQYGYVETLFAKAYQEKYLK